MSIERDDAEERLARIEEMLETLLEHGDGCETRKLLAVSVATREEVEKIRRATRAARTSPRMSAGKGARKTRKNKR